MTKPKPPTNSPAFILYGLDANGQPRAASFSADQADLVTKAAESLKLKVARVETPEQIELARELPPGQILAPGKGVVPTVRKELYDKLVAAVAVAKKAEAPPENPARPVGGMSAVAQTASEAPKPKRPPTNWAEIDVGDLVLAEDGGWYEAVVLERIGDDQFKLRFRDYPEEGVVVRRRNALGLLRPLA